MKLMPYPEYKDSGVEWLDTVPSHWITVPIKCMATEKGSLFLDGDWIESKDISSKGIRYITTGNVGEGRYKEQGAGYISQEKFIEIGCTEVYEGDLLISRLNAPIGRSCIVPNLEARIVTSVDNVIFRPNKSYSKMFLKHLFSSKDYFKHTGNLARGATMQRISRGLLGNIRIPLPQLQEQIHIATFLDHETARIDTLIEKQQKLIALLKEKRQAVISHAVTKGLNPNAPMKESGIEWLGEVPEHWNVAPIKHISSFQSGIAKGRSVHPDEVLRVPYIRVANVQDGFLDLTDVTDLEIRRAELSRYLLKEGDVLMNEGGDFDKLGRGAIWNGEIEPCIHQNHVFAIRPTKVESEWLTTATQATYAKFYFILVSKQSTNLASISSSNLKEAPIVMPPQDERMSILKFISEQMNKIDALMEKAEYTVELLQERRTALISAAVTGKIDVRNHPSARDAA